MFKKKNYKFTDKKQSPSGMASALYFLMALALMAMSVWYSFKKGGHGSTEVGALAMMAMVVSIIGFILGLLAFKEDEIYLKLPWIGTVGNALTILFLMGVILVGA